jgi:hypothetical protein
MNMRLQMSVEDVSFADDETPPVGSDRGDLNRHGVGGERVWVDVPRLGLRGLRATVEACRDQCEQQDDPTGTARQRQVHQVLRNRCHMVS